MSALTLISAEMAMEAATELSDAALDFGRAALSARDALLKNRRL